MDRQRRRRHHRRSLEDPSQDRREGGVGHRMGRRRVHRSPQRVCGERVEDQRHQVVVVDPADVLPASPQPAADPQLEGQEHRAQRSACRTQHKSGAQVDDPDARTARLVRLRFPRLAHLGKEAPSRASLLRDALDASGAVEADRRRRDEDRRGPAQTVQGRHQRPGAQHSALADRVLLGGSPAASRDALAGQVHDGVHALQALGLDPVLHRVPVNLAPGTVGLAPHDRPDDVPAGREEVAQGRADEAAGAGDRNGQRLAPVRGVAG